MNNRSLKILSFDIEDWFHILDNESTNSTSQWSKFESRIYTNVNRILEMLDTSKNSASFFVLGWIAKKYPEIVKKIHTEGYKIGSHSNLHQLAYLQSRKQFKEDTLRSIQILEDLTGKKVRYFRAPGFSITDKNTWAFEILYELGIEIDCSIFPAKRAHGGMPSYGNSYPSIICYNGLELKELPLNICNVFGKKVVFSGGGYFRILPYSLIKHCTQNSKYVMSYFHPRDFDPGQPRIKDLSLIRKFKSYVGLSSAEFKMNKWLSDFKFTDIDQASKLIDWSSVKKVYLK